MRPIRTFILAALSGAVLTAPALAADAYKVGAAVALSGYLATVDRAWTDGLNIAVDDANKSGGVLGRKISLTADDMQSDPAVAVTVVNKLITSDRVNVLINGCSSAGNAAIAPRVDRAKIPMLLCSILPPKESDQKWAISFLPLPSFEIETRLAYLQKHTSIKKIGILHDPTPYIALELKSAKEEAGKYGLEIVDIEQYQQTDADMTAYITKMKAAGAEAVVKLGVGPTTITTAKAIKQLGLSIPLLSGQEETSSLKPAAEVLGASYIFVAPRLQLVDVLPKGDPSTKAAAEFLKLWQAKFGDRDPSWGSRAWDAFHLVTMAIKKANSTDGAKVMKAIETITGYQGAGGEIDLSATEHHAYTKNPFLLATMANGKMSLLP